MTHTILGLSVRWQTSFDWRLAGRLAPRHLGGHVVARAGSYLVGLDPATGAMAWRYLVNKPILDGFVLEICGEVAITDWRDHETRLGHLVAVDADGHRRWDVELASGVHTTAVKLDDRSLAAVVLGETWEVVVVDPEGGLKREPLPSSGSTVARLPGGSWVVGATGLARGKPSLYVLSGGASRAVEDAAPQVVKVISTADHLITIERTGEARELVVRGHDLGARWRTSVASEFVAVTNEQVWMLTGERDCPRPTAFDLQTGEVRWRGDALPMPGTRVASSRELVLFGHEEGAVLLSTAGAVIGEREGYVGALDASGDGILLFVDEAVTCLERR